MTLLPPASRSIMKRGELGTSGVGSARLDMGRRSRAGQDRTALDIPSYFCKEYGGMPVKMTLIHGDASRNSAVDSEADCNALLIPEISLKAREPRIFGEERR